VIIGKLIPAGTGFNPKVAEENLTSEEAHSAVSEE
jgi:hypothetical protein